MNKNPIRKMHVGWAHSWLGGINSTPPKSARKWVAVCPECKEIIRTPYTANSRKVAKDWLYLHMKAKH